MAITRRQFVKNTFAAGAGTLFLGTGIVDLSKVLAASPNRGGTVRYALESSDPNDTLDPMMVVSNIDSSRCFQLYNQLVRMGNDMRPQPALAESWEPDGTATDWVFKIRKGVTFHNGKSMTSADVVYSIKRHLGEKTESRIKAYMAQIAEVKAEDDHTVRIKIRSPNAEFPVLFSGVRAGIVPDGHTDFDKPIGTGPFKFKEFKPGIRSVFVRNENYWRDPYPFVDAVEMFSIPDPVARVNALMSGEVEAVISVDAKSIPLLKMSDNIEIIAAKSGQLVFHAMMCDRPPTNNNDFRLAMKYLQDREKVIKGVYKGYAQIGNDHPIAPTDPMYSEEIPIRPYDPDKAKFHLKKAGMENPNVVIYTSSTAGPGNVEQALMFQQTAAAAGVTVQVRQTPPEGYWSHTWQKYPIFGSNWNARPTADLMYATKHMSDSTQNETRYVNKKIDQLIIQARATLDETKRKAIWTELQMILHEEGGDLVPCFVDYLHGRQSRLMGMDPHPMGALGDQFSAETVWLA